MKYKLTRKQKKTLKRILLAFALLVVDVVVTRVFEIEGILKLILFLIPYIIVGYDVLRTAGINIIHGQVFDEKFLMTVATMGAILTGEYPEATAVMLFYQVGELFQSIAVGRSRKSIAKLMDIRPDSAVVIREGQEIEVSPDEVEIGERKVDGNQLKWSTFHDFPAQRMYSVVQEWVFPFIKNLHGDKNSAYSKYMDDAIFKVNTPLMLSKIVDAMDEIYSMMEELHQTDIRGDVYEYLLSKIAQSGVNGQFRTPRHIIRMMVEMMDPKPTDLSVTQLAELRDSLLPAEIT